MKKSILILLSLLLASVAIAQTTVTGRITSSDDGTPIPFATLQIKGVKGLGSTTDSDGKYSLSGLPKDAVIIVSYIGYATQEIAVAGRSVIDIVLKPDALNLDEVMVVAYGVAKKGTYTGAASLVKADAIKDIPKTSFEGALSGRVAGLQITPGSGQAGSTQNIRIRGTGSMNASNEPLYVIDGVPVVSGDITQLAYVSNNVLSTLNPSDIESITVLKDAAASSLYGSRAANGIIMITTKRGKEGRMALTFKANMAFTPSFATENFEIASAEQQEILMYDKYYNEYMDSGKTHAQADAYAAGKVKTVIPRDPRGFYDWEKALFRTAVFQSYDLSVNGGSDKSSYYASLSYTDEQGRNRNNGLSRFSGRLNINQKIGKIVELASNISISNVDKSGFNDSRSTGANYFMASRNLLFPHWWPTALDGTPVTSRYRSYAYNYLYYDKLRENTSNTTKVSAVETLLLKLTDDLNVKSVFSYDETRVDDYSYYSPLHYSGSNKGGIIDTYSTKILRLISSTTVNYAKTFAEKHNVTLLAGFEGEKNKTDFIRASGSNLPNTTARTVQTAGTKDGTAYYWGDNMISILSRAEYNYDAKYYLSASLRRDASSRLSKEERWGQFWSVSGAWRINNEAFMSGVDWISNLRIRASYGSNGTLPIDKYGSMPLYSFGNNYNGNAGGVVSTSGNTALTWESSHNTSMALETGFFENRFGVNIEYFNRISKDLLQDVPTSQITGFSSTLANFGEMKNSGLEIEITGDIIRNGQLTWDAGLTASFIKSKVTKLYDGAQIVWYDPTGDDDRAKFVFREGESPKSFYGSEYAGVDRETGKPMWFLNNEGTADGQVDGRNITYNRSKASEVIIGCADPSVYGGFRTGLRWKDLSVNFNFSYSFGGQTYDATEKDNGDDGYYSSRTMSKYYFENRWTPDHKDAIFPRIVYDQSSSQGFQSRKLHSGDYIRLKDLSVSYSIPKSFINKFKIQNARVFFSATNLWTWAAFKGYDPEVNVYGTRGWEMPVGKTINFGVEIGL